MLLANPTQELTNQVSSPYLPATRAAEPHFPATYKRDGANQLPPLGFSLSWGFPGILFVVDSKPAATPFALYHGLFYPSIH